MKLKAKDSKPVFILTLNENELEALYNSIDTTDPDRFVNDEQHKLAIKAENMIAEYV